MASEKLQADPGEITWHEGLVSATDSNTPNAETSKEEYEPVTGLNVFAKVGLQIGKAAEEMEAATNKIGQLARALERNTPTDGALATSGIFSTGTPLVLVLGSPDSGTFWELTSFAIGGTEVNVTANVSHWGLYTSAYPTLAGAGLANAVDWAGTSPFIANYSSAQLVVNDGEYLFAIVFGGTNGLTYMASTQFRSYNVIASQGQTSYAI